MLQSGHQDSTYRPVGAGDSNVRVASHISSSRRQSDGRQQNGVGPLVRGGRFEIWPHQLPTDRGNAAAPSFFSVRLNGLIAMTFISYPCQ